MATLRELRRRFKGASSVTEARFGKDEVLVADVRGQMSPSRYVEEKFRAAMATRFRAAEPPAITKPR